MAKTCYPTTFKFDDGSVRVVNHQCTGSPEPGLVIFDHIQYVSTDGLKDIVPVWDESGGCYVVNISDLLSFFYCYSDGSLLVTTTNPSEMFIHAFIGDGVHGVHGLKINVS